MSQFIVLIILIFVNAFFAATEMAFVSLNDAKITIKAKEGDKKAISIEKMLKNPSGFLATIQIGITLAGFLSSAFASEAFADDLAPFLNSLIPSVTIETFKTISIVIITILLSYFTLVFGELVPKRLAMKNSEKIAYFAIGIIKGIAVIASPFVKFLTFSTNIISKIFGVSESDEETVTEEEIRMMVDVGQESGTIEDEEKEMINNIFEFNDKTVSEIMCHRTDIFAINQECTISEALQNVIEDYKHSRIPVYDESVDNIVGILHLKDLLKNSKDESKQIKEIMREAFFVPQYQKINDLFKDMQQNKTQVGIVLDEYGGTAGIVTMKDILEEIVGNMYDEFDEEEIAYTKIDDNTYLLEGSLPIYDVRKILHIDIPEGDYDTLSGYIIEELGRIPQDNEYPEIETPTVTFKVEEYEDKRIMWVKACKNLNK